MDVQSLLEMIFCIYAVFFGMAMTAYFISLCREEWERAREKRQMRKEQRERKRGRSASGYVSDMRVCGVSKS